jgi:hypothetical protein
MGAEVQVRRTSGVAALMLLVACGRHDAALHASEDAAARTAVVDAAPPRVLVDMPWQTDLFDEVADGGPKVKVGVVSIPLGAREARPIMIALHGALDRPEWACGSWRGVSNAYPILVCPRGVGHENALGWTSVDDTQRRIARAIAASKKLLGDWVRDDATVVLAGFSMGALHAALLAQREPMRYRRVVLGESAFRPESAMAFGAPWAKGGGERVVLLCSTRGCPAPYRAAGQNVANRGAHARVNDAGTSEHGVFDTVVRSMRRDWPWLVDGTPGWDAYQPPKEDKPLPGSTVSFDPR